jgi:hypothetical protein
MAVVLRNDERLTAAFFSLDYDLDGDDELDVVSAFQWSGLAIAPRGPYFHYLAPVESLAPTTASFVGEFGGLVPPSPWRRTLRPASGAFAGGYQMGTVVWRVNAGVESDGADITSGGAFYSAAGNYIADQLLFHPASVNASVSAVPEPGTAALLALGLVGVALASRPPAI